PAGTYCIDGGRCCPIDKSLAECDATTSLSVIPPPAAKPSTIPADTATTTAAPTTSPPIVATPSGKPSSIPPSNRTTTTSTTLPPVTPGGGPPVTAGAGQNAGLAIVAAIGG